MRSEFINSLALFKRKVIFMGNDMDTTVIPDFDMVYRILFKERIRENTSQESELPSLYNAILAIQKGRLILPRCPYMFVSTL